REQESLLVEARSVPGYSGSPVFVYIPSTTQRHYVHQKGKTLRNLGGPADQTSLLGLDWRPLLARHRLEGEDKGKFSDAQQNLWTRQNTMMIGVIPAYLIADLLMSEEETKWRNEPS